MSVTPALTEPPRRPTPIPLPEELEGEEVETAAPRAGRLDREEEERLCRAAQEGDPRALGRMVQAHLPLVRRLARRYQRAAVALDDLVNEGNIGLVRAVRKFDASHGLPFVPYAVWWIKQSIIMFLIQHGQGAISLPIRKVQFLKRMRREEDGLKTLLGRRPTDQELASHLSRPLESIREARHLMPEYVAWEDYLREDRAPGTCADAHPAEANVDQGRLRRGLEQLVSNLPVRDREGVRLYFGLDGGHGMNFADLGRSLSMTREGARQMIKRSLRRMRADPRSGPLESYL